MALYRCAACGSPNVVTDTQQQGYDYVKGAIGTVVLGVGGAAAGINGKTKRVYKCPDCGLTLNDPMPFEIKTLIDIGVMSPASRKNLKLGDVPIDWEVFTRKYKNIEQTTAGDSIAENTVTPSSQKQEEPVEITEENKRNSVIYKVALVKYIEACKKWSDDYIDMLDKRKEYFDSLWDAERENLQKQIANKRDAKVKEHTTKREQYAKEKQEAEATLSTLGMFQFGVKRDIKQRISQLTDLMSQEDVFLRDAQNEYTTEMDNVKSRLRESSGRLHAEANTKYPIPLKPQKPGGMIEFLENGQSAPAENFVFAYDKEAVFRYVEKEGKVSYAQIKELDVFAGITDSLIRGLINEMVKDGELECSGNFYTVNHIIPYRVLPDITADELAIYEEYEKKKAEEKAKKEQQKKMTNQQILDAIKGKGPMSASQMIENLPALNCYTTQTLSPILNRMVEDGIIVKTTVQRRSYFEYK